MDNMCGYFRTGSCSKQFQTFLNEGTILVENKESFNTLPPVPGLLSYREDNEKLYVNKGNKWDEIGREKETENLTAQVKQLRDNLQDKIYQQDAQIKNLETDINEKLQNLSMKNSQQDARIQNLERNINAKLQNLEDKLKKIETKLNALPVYGSISNPGMSCKDILARGKFVVSGTYWIKLTSSKPFQVYCDMETYGGDWTLVYSYTFTNYDGFGSTSNAVTPRPNWPAIWANVPISTTPPLNESSLGAVDWNLWKNIGQEFMVKSNINDWIVCQPNGGSLVTKKHGSMSCQNIKNVATACNGVVPYRIHWNSYGPYLSASSTYYYFDGYRGSDWPIHNPCGKVKGDTYANQKKGVSNPGGQIFVR